MCCDDVRAALRARFDNDEALDGVGDTHLVACPACSSYLRELLRLKSAFHNLTLEVPSARFLAEVSAKVQQEVGISRRRRVVASAALAVLCAASLTAGILYPVAFDPAVWWSWLAQGPPLAGCAESGQPVAAELERLAASAQREVASLLHVSTWTWWVVLCALVGGVLALGQLESRRPSAGGGRE
ncbi:MAG: hypothetical protein AMXMBFR4_32760 [Candidatus Hydrogenedentota bacterium]